MVKDQADHMKKIEAEHAGAEKAASAFSAAAVQLGLSTKLESWKLVKNRVLEDHLSELEIAIKMGKD